MHFGSIQRLACRATSASAEFSRYTGELVRSINVSLPGNIRCEPNATGDYDPKRKIDWPATAVGSRRFVRCPYAYERSSYAHRDCILSSIIDQSPKWTDADASTCPAPPFSRAVDRLANFTVRTELKIYRLSFSPFAASVLLKLAFHDADTDTDILARIVSRECRRVVQLAVGITSGNRACRTCR